MLSVVCLQVEEAAEPNIDYQLVSKCKAMIKVCHWVFNADFFASICINCIVTIVF